MRFQERDFALFNGWALLSKRLFHQLRWVLTAIADSRRDREYLADRAIINEVVHNAVLNRSQYNRLEDLGSRKSLTF